MIAKERRREEEKKLTHNPHFSSSSTSFSSTCFPPTPVFSLSLSLFLAGRCSAPANAQPHSVYGEKPMSCRLGQTQRKLSLFKCAPKPFLSFLPDSSLSHFARHSLFLVFCLERIA